MKQAHQSSRIAVAGLCLCMAASLVRAQTPDADGVTPHRDGTIDVRADSLARKVTIYRDVYGVPHVHGETDEAAVFGLAYARAEDQFEQIEDIFISRLGRSSELYGTEGLFGAGLKKGTDLFVHAYGYLEEAQTGYELLPPKLKEMVNAYVAGLNYYLEKNPRQEVRLLDHFEPWWVVAVEDFSESFRGREHSGVFESNADVLAQTEMHLERGSNTWAVGPGKTASGNAMLSINPHDPSHRPYYECHIMSDEGLNSYGVMNYWGAILLPYIGFNEHLGWSVTVNEPDLGDAFELTFDHPSDSMKYRFGDRYLTADTRTATIRIRENGGIVSQPLPVLETIHGPVLAVSDEGRPVSFRIARSESGTFTEQLYRMHKANSLEEWREAVAMRGLTYHNLMYADRDGNIYYLYNGNVPVRNDSLDWTTPVDGSDPRTLWKGYHGIDELPQLLNPGTGYLQNSNSSPFVTTHSHNPDSTSFPRYMTNLENGDLFRAQRSRQLLKTADSVTLDSFQDMITDNYVHAADEWLPMLFAEWQDAATTKPALYERLREPIAALRQWNRRSEPTSFETTLFVLWDEAYWLKDRQDEVLSLATSLDEAVSILEGEFGTWKIPWKEIFRHQKTADGDAVYWDESRPSYPTAGNHGRYGTLMTMRGTPYDGTRESVKRRMKFGNSYVSVVEFSNTGPVARSIVAYGNSTRPESPHYTDQTERFAKGEMKPVLFKMGDILKNLEEQYHPGERRGQMR